ncbi:mannosyltransferase [Dispira simplex]|nr:mannosyltransferase [Dispira simplex]
MSPSSPLRRRSKAPPVAFSNRSPPHHCEKIKKNSLSTTIYVPSFTVAFGLLACFRVLSAVIVPLQDCDEVFNYWEPLHYLQFGRGFQTWEYSPHFGIRSWAYIGLHAVVAKLLYLMSFIMNKAQLFYALRITLAVVCAVCEARFYRSVVRYVNPRIGRYTLVALLGSAGMTHASNALLPSSFAMYAAMLASPYMLQSPSLTSGKRIYYGVFWIAFGALLGWPFAAAVGFPFVAEELLVGRIITVPGRARAYRDPQLKTKHTKDSKGPSVFNAQPHKEERFLYIVYPWICFAAAITLHLARVQMDRIFHSLALTKVTPFIPWATFTTLALYVILSLLRVGGLVYHFQAPLTVHYEFYNLVQKNSAVTNMNQTIASPLVCTAKEWYRFPSHYFIPYPYRVGFVKSSFRGQLPKYFAEPSALSSSRTYRDQLPMSVWPPKGTFTLPQGFNDLNQEEADVYVNLDDCDFIVDYYSPKQSVSHQEPAFVLDTDHWRRSLCRPFLDARHTHPLLRAVYIPRFLHAPLLTTIRFFQSLLQSSITTKSSQPSLDDAYTWGEYCTLERVKG